MVAKAVEVRQVSKVYGNKTVLNNISCQFNQGMTVGLIGPNGAGKTTLESILVHLVLPTRGEVYINGKSISKDPEFNRHLVFMPAEPKFPPISVQEYVLDCAYLRDFPKNEALNRLHKSPLAEHRSQSCNSLSTGQKKILQIIALNIVYLSVSRHLPSGKKPKLTVILDEPFNGLDPTNRHLFIDNIKIWQNWGWTIVISSHNLHDIQVLADYVFMIKKGKPVYVGPITPDIEQTYREKFIETGDAGLFEL